ncbi:unnamed protein product, partial [Ectocarpus fasciculatus]
GAVKDDAGGGSGSSAPGVKGPGPGGAGEEEDDDRTCLAAAKRCPRRAKGGDVLALIDSVFGRLSRSSKLPGMRWWWRPEPSSEYLLCDRPVALPVTATVQTRGSRLFARANNLAELTESRKAAASSSCSCRLISEAAGRVPEGEGRRFRARAGQGESDR